MYLFRNDYSFGAHPKVLEALAATNMDGNVGYGEDAHTENAKALIRAACHCPTAAVEFLIGGTQTNFIAIADFLRPWEGVISPKTGHINGHEVGAVEATGHKILALPVGEDGKLRPEHMTDLLELHADPHLVKPRLVYISDATECGTVYTKAELTELSVFCRANDLLLFVDGARLGAALTSSANDLTLADMARLTDAFYIGGTKNGALFGEALVITNPALQPDFFRMKKRLGGVLAKGWLLGAQFEALMTDNLYFDMARHANEMAALLQAGLKAKGYGFMVESPTNQVFPIFPNSYLPTLETLCAFEEWDDADEARTQMVVRFVCCFGTEKSEVEGILAALPNA